MNYELLRKVHLFGTLDDEELEQVWDIGKRERLPGDHHIFKEGELGEDFFLILEGAVRVSKMIPGVGEEALAVLKPGNYFGEMALIDRFPRSADAICQEDCELLVIRKADFDDLLFFNQALANKLLWMFCKTLSNRLRETNDKIRALFAIARSF